MRIAEVPLLPLPLTCVWKRKRSSKSNVFPRSNASICRQSRGTVGLASNCMCSGRYWTNLDRTASPFPTRMFAHHPRLIRDGPGTPRDRARNRSARWGPARCSISIDLGSLPYHWLSMAPNGSHWLALRFSFDADSPELHFIFPSFSASQCLPVSRRGQSQAPWSRQLSGISVCSEFLASRFCELDLSLFSFSPTNPRSSNCLSMLGKVTC